jgi:hypothetical protein
MQDPTQKLLFIQNLTSTVTAEIISKISQMPIEWDGHELRQYMADVYARQTSHLMKSGKRRRDYRNVVAVANL